MTKSIVSRYARRIKQTIVKPSAWRWPHERVAGEPSPDSRLLSATIDGLAAEVQLANGKIVRAGVRAVSQHDIVLDVACLTTIPVYGQVVEVSLNSKEWSILSHQKCIVHWSGIIHGENVVALFTVDPLGEVVEQWTYDQPRSEVRFPVDLPLAVQINDTTEVRGRMLDYSLNGCRFLCQEQIPLEQQYPANVMFQESGIEIGIHPRWVLNTEGGYQIGCTFQPERGVLLACRHHAKPVGLTSPLKPQTTNWAGEGDADEEVELGW